jgi:hypothetical protein
MLSGKRLQNLNVDQRFREENSLIDCMRNVFSYIYCLSHIVSE